jgi:hypothetical protein
MATLSPFPIMQFFDDNGDPLAGGKIYTYAAGTTTPKDTYVNASGTTANSNPIVLDSGGRVTNTSYAVGLWLGDGDYKFILTDADDTQIWMLDNIAGDTATESTATITSLKALAAGAVDVIFVKGYAADGDGGEGWFYWDSDSVLTADSGIIVIPDSTPATGRWIRYIPGGKIRVEWYGAKGNGTDNDVAAFSAADGYADTYGLSIELLPKTYYLASNPSVATTIIMPPGSVIKYGGTTAFNVLIDEGDTTQHFDVDSGHYPILSRLKTVRPEWFGAVANGTGDCTLALQQAIQSVALGGTVLLTGGSYLTTGTLEMKSNITLKGQGREYTFINRSNASGNCINIAEGITRWKLEGLAVHTDVSSSGYGILCAYDTENVELTDVRVSGFKFGINIYSGEDYNWQSVIVDCSDIADSIGVTLGNPADSTYKTVNKVSIVNSSFKNCAGIGLYCNRADGVVLVGAEFNDCGTPIKTSMNLTAVSPRFIDWDTYIIDSFQTTSPTTSIGKIVLVAPYAELSGSIVTDLKTYLNGGSVTIINNDTGTKQVIAGALTDTYTVCSDTNTHCPTIVMRKSGTDAQGPEETPETHDIGKLKFQAVNSSDEWVDAAGIRVYQSSAAGSSYVPAEVHIEAASDDAASMALVKFIYPSGSTYDTGMFLAYNSGGSVSMAQVTLGELDSGGTGCRVLRIGNNDAPNGMGPQWRKYTIDYNDVSADDVKKSINLEVFGPRSIIHSVCIKPTVEFAGGTITAVTAEVGYPSGDTDKYLAAYTLGTPGDDVFQLTNNGGDIITFSSPIPLSVTVKSTGGNLDTLTAGEFNVWILISRLG